MKTIKFYQALWTTVVLIGFSTAVPAMNSVVMAEEVHQQQRTINVTGEGQILVQPDIAYIQLGVQTQENTVEQAQLENAEALQNIYASLEKEHIKQEDIQTVSFNVNPIYTWDQNKQTFQGYQVLHILRVTDRDLEHIGSLLDHVSQSGANKIDMIQFDTEKREKYQLEALDLAIDHAQQKANHIAEKISQTNLSIVSLHENNTYSGPIFSSAQKSAAHDASTQISTGQITITASVDVTYSY